tara:strand:+ start:307 stop:465 length:159 start_codon:yes stop_codon:yes gene_type:complete
MSEDGNLKFYLTVDEANVILAGLGELPAKLSMGLISKIKSQAEKQQQEEGAE